MYWIQNNIYYDLLLFSSTLRDIMNLSNDSISSRAKESLLSLIASCECREQVELILLIFWLRVTSSCFNDFLTLRKLGVRLFFRLDTEILLKVMFLWLMVAWWMTFFNWWKVIWWSWFYSRGQILLVPCSMIRISLDLDLNNFAFPVQLIRQSNYDD